MKMHQTLIAAALMMVVGSGIADWTLDADDSRLNFTFVKKSHIVEPGSFGTLSGGISSKGDARLEVNLNTVNTLITIRNQRMQEFLFETTRYPSAVYTAPINPSVLNAALAADSGEQLLATLNGELELHGVKKPLNAEVIVTKTGPNSLSVDSASPIIIQAADYHLIPGIDKLQQLAKLPHIIHAVPVNFHLVFRTQ